MLELMRKSPRSTINFETEHIKAAQTVKEGIFLGEHLGQNVSEKLKAN